MTLIRRLTVQVENPKSIAASIEGGRIISESVTSSKTIFCYNYNQEALKQYLEAIDYITQRYIRDNFINAISLSLIIFSNYLLNAAIFAASKTYILNSNLNSDDMAIVQTIMGEAFSTISSYMKSVWQLRKGLVITRSIYSTLETESLIPPFLKDNVNKLNTKNIKGKIEFKHVYFAYPSQPEHIVLKDISFSVLPGQKVALVGNSGSGKSTVIQLLNRFYDIEEGKGEILIDDVNIKKYNLYELRKKIGFVEQNPSLFKRSNLENIRYGNLKASDEKCYEAAKKVNALKILEKEENNKNIKKLPLSAGEKQKLSIARIFLKNPRILLLDEPTSALDKESEEEIEKSLDKLTINKTTIMISHKLNTIENCDNIFVFDDGYLFEQGTHNELMKLEKRYYNLRKYTSFNLK